MKQTANYCFSGSASGFPAQLGAYAYCSQYFNPISTTGTSGGGIDAALVATTGSIIEAKQKMESFIIPELLDYYYPLLKSTAILDNSKMAMIRGEKIYSALKKVFPMKFSETKIPLTIITTDIHTRQLVKFSSTDTPNEDVAFALRASLSIPFVFSPVKYGDMLLVDGGLTSNFYLRNYKNSSSVIGIKFNDTDDFKPVTCAKDMLMAMLFTSITENERRDIAECPQAQIIPLVIDIDMLNFEGMTPKYMRDMYYKGFDLACKFLKV